MLTESQVSLSEAFLQVHEKNSTSLQGSRGHKVSVTVENSGRKECLFKNLDDPSGMDYTWYFL